VPPYTVINQKIGYKFDVPVIGDKELLFGREFG
jgi:hypothetical protein